ncbi:MAG: sugar-binding transcriptional regulator [Planctomycetes bacterium]|nr:sugar-binding transcriptional regulator [Planctomycetota bacterium]
MNYDLRQIIEVARMYHVVKLSQHEISERLKLSRPKISRILRQAEERGIVRVAVVDPMNDSANLEKALIEEFGLRDARVINTLGLSGNQLRVELGRTAAEYLIKILKPRDILGVAWGSTTLEVAKQMPNYPVEDMKVTSLFGCTYENVMDEGIFDMARIFARRLGARLYLLYTPVIVSSTAVRDVYLSENHTKLTMENIDLCNIALNGVGIFWRNSMLYQYGYIKEDKWRELAKRGAVGNICSRYYDADGNPVDEELESRTIGVSFEQIRNKESSIGVAIGAEKVAAILGAIRGKLITTLITDEDTAKAVMKLGSGRRG